MAAQKPALPPGYAEQDRGTELLVTTWVFTGLSIIVVSLKLFTRSRIQHLLGLDDFFIILSLALVVVCAGIFTYDVQIGMGKHAAVLPLDQLVLAVKVNFIGNPFGVMAYSLPNISVAILLVNLLSPDNRLKWSLYALVISQNVIAGISLVILFTQCMPTEYLWNPTIEPHHCLSSSVITGYSYFVGSFSALTDVILAVVPIATFWNLQMRLKTKIGVSILMGLTLLAAICAIVKTTKLSELAQLDDFTYATVDLVIWVIIEANVIIMAASIPTLRPFVYSFKKRGTTEEESFEWQNHSGSATTPNQTSKKGSRTGNTSNEKIIGSHGRGQGSRRFDEWPGDYQYTYDISHNKEGV